MIAYEELIKLMDKHGYTESSRNMFKDEIASVSFHPKDFMNDFNYEVTVNLNSGDFTFFFVVPRSPVKVTLGPAGPVSNGEHFVRMKKKFLEVVEVLDVRFGN